MASNLANIIRAAIFLSDGMAIAKLLQCTRKSIILWECNKKFRDQVTVVQHRLCNLT